MADLLQGVQDRLVCILRAACVLPAGVDVITVRVDDVALRVAAGSLFFFENKSSSISSTAIKWRRDNMPSRAVSFCPSP